MKRPEKKSRSMCVDGKWMGGYNKCHDDFTAFLPSEEELKIFMWDLMVKYVPDGNCDGHEEIAKAIHKRLA